MRQRLLSREEAGADATKIAVFDSRVGSAARGLVANGSVSAVRPHAALRECSRDSNERYATRCSAMTGRCFLPPR